MEWLNHWLKQTESPTKKKKKKKKILKTNFILYKRSSSGPSGSFSFSLMSMAGIFRGLAPSLFGDYWRLSTELSCKPRASSRSQTTAQEPVLWRWGSRRMSSQPRRSFIHKCWPWKPKSTNQIPFCCEEIFR